MPSYVGPEDQTVSLNIIRLQPYHILHAVLKSARYSQKYPPRCSSMHSRNPLNHSPSLRKSKRPSTNRPSLPLPQPTRPHHPRSLTWSLHRLHPRNRRYLQRRRFHTRHLDRAAAADADKLRRKVKVKVKSPAAPERISRHGTSGQGWHRERVPR